MGMAASQARLLTLTARLADNELRSQTINNAKMRLATQSSQASENYINALNNATLKYTNCDMEGNAQTQALTYNALTAYSSYNTQYGLVNASNQLLVSEYEAAMFEASNGNLNTYLQLHGLEYNTTYFEELGALTNSSYPAPFDRLMPETLQTYYESYNSYSISTKVERYNKSFEEYKHAQNLLPIGTRKALKSFFTFSGNSPKVEYDVQQDAYVLNALTGMLVDVDYQLFKNAFIGNNNNTYNINYLKNSMHALTEDDYNAVKDYVNSYSTVNLNGVTYLKNTNNTNYTVSTPADDGSRTFTFDDTFRITVDGSDNVTSIIAVSGANVSFGSNDPNQPISTGQHISEFLSKLKTTFHDSTTNTNRELHYAAAWDNNARDFSSVKNYSLISNSGDAKAMLEDAVYNVMEYLTANLNYEAFADWLLANRAALPYYGIDVNTPIQNAGNKSLTEILQNYVTKKDTFINCIVDKTTPVQVDGYNYSSSFEYLTEALKNSVISAEDLTDKDLTLRFIKSKGLIMSGTYETVTKEYVVEEMIANFGEPKYAWIDETDFGNTGNADAKAQWYTNLFNRMNMGYKALENGLAQSKEWIEYALESGIVTMEQVDKAYNWKSLDYKTCTKIVEETDEEAVTKAEAEYNRAMNDIKAKDNIYDIQLKNIDTEHTSLQTEYDTIKEIIKKNIDRNFKFNQSA